MKISEAQNLINEKFAAGLISIDESNWYNQMIRRSGGYGNKWSWKEQDLKRANLLKDF
jgi:hypothetical protein